jgi:putative addiction module killer protein
MYDVRHYLDAHGTSPFETWFSGLNRHAQAKITIAVIRMENGNLSNTKSVGEGVLEYRLHYGPGYRIYFALDGDVQLILLAGGSKVRQSKDIHAAKERWQDYKNRKHAGETQWL